MAQETVADTRGIVVFDPRQTLANIGDSTTYGTSFTQAGRKPGRPVAQQADQSMIVKASGSMPDYDVRVRTIEGGRTLRGTFGWRNDDDASSMVRGMEAPFIEGFDSIESWSGSANRSHPDVISISNTELLACFSWSSAPNSSIKVVHYDTSTSTKTESTIATNEFPTVTKACLVKIEDADYRCYWITDNGTYWSIGHARSSNGTSWSIVSHNAFPDSTIDNTDLSPRKITGGSIGGNVVLFVQFDDTTITATNAASQIYQLGSSDDGHRFSLVDSAVSTTISYGFPHLRESCDRSILHLIYITSTNAGNPIQKYRRLPSCLFPFTSATEIEAFDGGSSNRVATKSTVAGGGFNISTGNAAIAEMSDGTIRTLVMTEDTSPTMYIQEVKGSPLTSPWTTYSYQPISVEATISEVLASGASMCQHGSRLYIATKWDTTETSYDGNIALMAMGQWSTLSRPYQANGRRGNPDKVIVPAFDPDDAGWTETLEGSAATPTVVNGNGTNGDNRVSREFSSAGATSDASYWQADFSQSDVEAGILVFMELRYDDTSTGTLSTLVPNVGALISYSDGTDRTRLYVMVTSSDIRLYDAVASANIGTISTTPERWNQIAIWVQVTGGAVTCKVWAAQEDGGLHEDMPLAPVTITAPTLESNNSSPYLLVGNPSTYSGSGNLKSRWGLVWIVTGSAIGDGLNNYSNPTDVVGHPWTVCPTVLPGGLGVEGLGWSTTGDEWLIDRDYDYGIANAMPLTTRSPGAVWRSTQTANDEIIAWRLNAADSTHYSYHQHAILALYIHKPNWRTGKLEVRFSSGSYITSRNIDLSGSLVAPGLSGSYTRSGATIKFTDMDDVWFREGEFEGRPLQLSSTVFRTITYHASGAGVDPVGSDTVGTFFMCEDCVSGDPTSGTGYVFPHAALILVAASQAAAIDAIRLTIDGGQPCPDAYFEASKIGIGWYRPFGRPYDNNRRRTFAPRQVLTEYESGARRHTELSTGREEVSFQWTDPIDTAGTYISTSPDWISVENADRDAAPADTADLVNGIVRRAGGAKQPVVGVFRVPFGGLPADLNREGEFLYGAITSDTVARGTIRGAENYGELVTVSTITLSEEK